MKSIKKNIPPETVSYGSVQFAGSVVAARCLLLIEVNADMQARGDASRCRGVIAPGLVLHLGFTSLRPFCAVQVALR